MVWFWLIALGIALGLLLFAASLWWDRHRRRRASRRARTPDEVVLPSIPHKPPTPPKERKKQQAVGLVEEPEQTEGHPLETGTIVEIVKPIGVWTNFVTRQKLTFLSALGWEMNQGDPNEGFWVKLIRAQGKTRGHERGQGR